ncbi:MAG: hypothetical protein ACSLEM_01840 [Candidatus Malihini olakiniferum]
MLCAWQVKDELLIAHHLPALQEGGLCFGSFLESYNMPQTLDDLAIIY